MSFYIHYSALEFGGWIEEMELDVRVYSDDTVYQLKTDVYGTLYRMILTIFIFFIYTPFYSELTCEICLFLSILLNLWWDVEVFELHQMVWSEIPNWVSVWSEIPNEEQTENNDCIFDQALLVHFRPRPSRAFQTMDLQLLKLQETTTFRP